MAKDIRKTSATKGGSKSKGAAGSAGKVTKSASSVLSKRDLKISGSSKSAAASVLSQSVGTRRTINGEFVRLVLSLPGNSSLSREKISKAIDSVQSKKSGKKG